MLRGRDRYISTIKGSGEDPVTIVYKSYVRSKACGGDCELLFVLLGTDCGRIEVKLESCGKNRNRRRIEISRGLLLWRPRSARELLLNDRQDGLADITACLFLTRAVGIEAAELNKNVR